MFEPIKTVSAPEFKSGKQDRRSRNIRKVFGIGFNKTGTTSLATALRRLGFSPVHFAPAVSDAVKRALIEGIPLLTHVDKKNDAFTDLAIIRQNFALLDRQYPDSRFILHTRDIEDWLESRRNHVANNCRLAAKGFYSGNFLEVDISRWRREWKQHHQEVLRHFRDTPARLLVIDLTRGNPYDNLCRFLGVQPVDEPFPKENVSRD